MTQNKYSVRSIPLITRDDYQEFTTKEKSPNWLNDFENNLEKNLDKSAVQTAKNDKSLYEQISSILGSKSKFSTVDEAVNDMKKRTGLTDFLKKKANEERENILVSMPEVKTFIDNFIKDRPGVAIEAVVHELLKMNPIRNNLPDRNDVPDYVRKYINKKIIEVKKEKPSRDMNNSNLGKTDLSDNSDGQASENDPLASLNPAIHS